MKEGCNPWRTSREKSDKLLIGAQVQCLLLNSIGSDKVLFVDKLTFPRSSLASGSALSTKYKALIRARLNLA